MLKAGNRVHFETGNCYVEEIRTGKKTKIDEREGTFEVGIWVPAATDNREHNQVTRNPKSTFHRQDEGF